MKLRPISENELSLVYEWYLSGDYEIFFRHFDALQPFGSFLNQINASGNFVLGIYNDKFVGALFVKHYRRSVVSEVSLIVDVNEQGVGNAIEAFRLAARIIFSDLRSRKIVLCVASDDDRTNAIVRKFGFLKEATYRESCYYGQEFHDENRMILLREDFEQLDGGN